MQHSSTFKESLERNECFESQADGYVVLFSWSRREDWDDPILTDRVKTLHGKTISRKGKNSRICIWLVVESPTTTQHILCLAIWNIVRLACFRKPRSQKVITDKEEAEACFVLLFCLSEVWSVVVNWVRSAATSRKIARALIRAQIRSCRIVSETWTEEAVGGVELMTKLALLHLDKKMFSVDRRCSKTKREQ